MASVIARMRRSSTHPVTEEDLFRSKWGQGRCGVCHSPCRLFGLFGNSVDCSRTNPNYFVLMVDNAAAGCGHWNRNHGVGSGSTGRCLTSLVAPGGWCTEVVRFLHHVE